MKRRSDWLVLFGFIVVFGLFAKACRCLSSVSKQTVEFRYMELPKNTYIENTVFITHYLPEQDRSNVRNYSLLYDTIQKISYWVAYPLHEMYLGNSGRSEAWNYDPLVARHLQPRAHTGIAGFDRGHQLPSADRTYSRAGNVSTFYFTNMTAQNASLNRGVWATLENRVRTWVAQCDTLYVVTGAMITTADDTEIHYAQDNNGHNMAIPKYYYKAVAQKRGANYYTVAYKFENAAPEIRNVDAYQMTVTELEEKTGFVFFPKLPNNAKDTVVVEYWR
jgi:endonuclease G